jgi:hypothetical protein
MKMKDKDMIVERCFIELPPPTEILREVYPEAKPKGSE